MEHGNPNNPPDRTLAVALDHLEHGRPADAARALGAILSRDPDDAEAHHLLGVLAVQGGDPVAGVAMIRRAAILAPGRAPHHNSLALAWRRLGMPREAARALRDAIALRPDSAELHNNLGATLRDLGDSAGATRHFRRAAAIAPAVAEIWSNLATALQHGGEPGEIEACHRRAIALNPRGPSGYAAFGHWLMTQARWREAAGAFQDANETSGGTAANWTNLGCCLQEMNLGAAAKQALRQALVLDPGWADAWYNLGCVLHADGCTGEAIACHTAAIAADPDHGAARLALCASQLPMVYRSTAEIAARRGDYARAVRDLAAATRSRLAKRAVAAAAGASQPFFLPYQGLDDRALQRKFSALLCDCAASGAAPRVPAHRRPGERVRVAVISGFFHDHTVYRLFLEGWLSELDRGRVSVTSFHTGTRWDAMTDRAAARSDRFVHGLAPGAWPDAVRRARPHVVLYPEIGMDPIVGRLAAHRLAPAQCVAWGHPNTTGLPVIDYFLSADAMEPRAAEAFYTETLVRLPGIGVHYTPDERPATVPDRDRIGAAGPVYWSGQAIFKYHPDFDEIYPRIAAAVGPCRFVFIAFAKSQCVTDIFRQRLVAAFARHGLDAEAYCAFRAHMDQEGFVAAAAEANVILDTPGWSGGKSTLDLLALAPAIVTLPGRFLRGRHTAGILRHIGCEMTIASSLDEYIAIAVRLGLDDVWRTAVREAVARNRHRAYRDRAPIAALERFLIDAASSAGPN